MYRVEMVHAQPNHWDIVCTVVANTSWSFASVLNDSFVGALSVVLVVGDVGGGELECSMGLLVFVKRE